MDLDLSSLSLRFLHKRHPRVQSFNIEMAELVGGTFWKEYTDAQIDGTEEYQPQADPLEKTTPIDLTSPRLVRLAKALGPAIVRFSGSWATRTYYDFSGSPRSNAPEGFDDVLTARQWGNALAFAKAIDAEIMVSVANCAGVHKNFTGEWLPQQAELLWQAAREQGCSIQYAQFMNEPNMPDGMHLPEGYDAACYARDHDLFARWLRQKHPETRFADPCATELPHIPWMPRLLTETLLSGCKEPMDIYSYNSYTGVSERAAQYGGHYDFSEVTSEAYLSGFDTDLAFHRALRDRFAPGAPIWITESADGACGGNTWAPTYAEAIRYLDELARFCVQEPGGVSFHNTLASGAYGLLEARTFQPRPAYWAAMLFGQLAGEAVYASGVPQQEGCHLYVFSAKADPEKKCWVGINTSRTEPLTLTVPDCTAYLVTAPALRSRTVSLNGTPLMLTQEDTLPPLAGASHPAGKLSVPPCGIAFLIF